MQVLKVEKRAEKVEMEMSYCLPTVASAKAGKAPSPIVFIGLYRLRK